ncbi:hypothetical protein WG954_10625 [Lacibacter sp. H375]|uniref:hypothetical protein n=1 Tax=Lacibacter sp. H375 TaxID=3133424 RepID=UPI0030BB1E71
MSEGCLHLRVILFILFIQMPVFMARTSNNIVTKGLRGQIGKQLVFKQYGKKTVVTRYPDMSKVLPSPLQKQQRSGFAEAVAYAQSINNDPILKAKYAKKVKKGKSVFQYAIQEFLKNKKVDG